MSLLALSIAALALPAQENSPSPPPAEVRTIRIGESVSAVLDPADPPLAGRGPSQRFELVLEEGAVTISLESYDFDAFLRVEGESGELLADDDDSGIETDARLVLAAQGQRACSIVVASKEGAGEFVLSVQPGDVPLPTGAALTDAAIAWRSTAAERALESGDEKAAANHRKEEGKLRLSRSEYSEAKTAYELSLEHSREVGDRVGEAKALGNLGIVCFSKGDYRQAREHFELSLVLLRELGDRGREATVLGNLGSVYRSLGDYPRAREHMEQSLALCRELDDGAGEAAALINLGSVYLALGDYTQTVQLYEEGLDVAVRVGHRQWEANALVNLGRVYSYLFDYPRARENAQEALAVQRELGDRAAETISLDVLGEVYFALRDYAKARESCEQLLALVRQRGDRASEARTLARLGKVYQSLGEVQRAREHLEGSLSLARELGDRESEARALGGLGILYGALGDHQKQKEHSEQSLVLFRELGNRASEAVELINLGGAYCNLGDYQQAVQRCEEGLAIARQVGHRLIEATGLLCLGNFYSRLGDYSRARKSLGESLSLKRQLGDRAGEGEVLLFLGNVYLLLGDYHRSRESYEKCLDVSREVQNRQREAEAVGNLGNVYKALGDHQLAVQHYERALALSRELGDRAGEAAGLINLGTALCALGDHAQERQRLEEGLDIARQVGHRDFEANALGNLGRVYNSLGDFQRAREHYEHDFALKREIGDRAGQVAALTGVCGTAIALGDSSAALEALEEAQRLLDGFLTVGLEGNEASALREQFAHLGRNVQDLAALRLAEAGEEPSARAEVLRWGFGAAGRWKGRALLEGIAEHRSGARTAEAIELRRGWRKALASRDAILERVSKAIHDVKPSAEIDALRSEADARLAEAQQLAARLREVSPEDAALDLPLGSSPEEVRGAVLGPHEILVEYAEGVGRLFAYVLGQETLEFLDLGAQEEIAAELERFLGGIRGLGRLAGPADVGGAGRALFERLLAPALAAAKEPIGRLVIVPSATVAALPFEALVIECTGEAPSSFIELTFVLDRYELTYGPSSPVLVELAGAPTRSEPGKLLLLADPRYGAGDEEGEKQASEQQALLAGVSSRAPPGTEDLVRLPGTRDEVLAIASLTAAESDTELAGLRAQRSGSLARERFELHLGGAASRARLAGDLRGYSAVHLACHGFVDADLPQQTGIALSPTADDEGWFTILDALELDLDAELVVLSACQTAQGAAKAGEGVESLARAFLYAGARGVIASLWQVEDRAAARTMEAFYAGWLQRGLAPAHALRAAKLALRCAELELGPARGIGIESDRAPARGTLESGHPFYWAPFIHVGLAGGGAPKARGEKK